MDGIEIKGLLKAYIRLPLYMLIPLAVVAVVLGILYNTLIIPMVIAVIIYAVVAVISYSLLSRRFARKLVDMAVGLQSSQRQFLEEMAIPYAVVDNDGKLFWYNNKFGDMAKDTDLKVSPVTSIFPEITKNHLSQAKEENVVVRVDYSERIFNVNIQALSHDDSGEGPTLEVYALMFFDETMTETYRQEIEESKLVVGNIYIDNYEDVMVSVDDTKRPLLEAVVERKIRKYFTEPDAIIRKVDRDKFFVIFPNRQLNKLIENKFSILEDIKNTKVGNEVDITISVGLGLNGGSYARDAEYAKSSINLALGRGGSQAVVKNGGEVSIFGVKGKEVEKNARVKARVKAQALRELIASRDNVVVMGHKLSDFDSLGAAIGIYCMSKELGKDCSIVLNTVTGSLRPIVDLFSEDEDYPSDLFVSNESVEDLLIGNDTLVVVVDTNIPYMTECPDLLEMTSDIVVIDHHRQGKDIIKNPILSYVEPYASSTCEMVAEIIQYFSENLRLNPMEADALYAGMLIDTNNFMTKTGVRTFEAAAYLRRSGADVMRVRKLLREDIVSYKTRAQIVKDAEVYRDCFAISVCDPEGLESPTVVGAQAANELLNILGIKASFVLTPLGDKVYISSRSIDEIDVQVIMEQLGGGGHLNIAGAQIEDSNIDAVKQSIMDILDNMIEEGAIR